MIQISSLLKVVEDVKLDQVCKMVSHFLNLLSAVEIQSKGVGTSLAPTEEWMDINYMTNSSFKQHLLV